MEVSAMGRYILISLLSPVFLKIGEMHAVFHAEGIFPTCKVILKKSAKGKEITSTIGLRSLAEIPSIPGELPFFKLMIILWIDSGVMNKLSIVILEAELSGNDGGSVSLGWEKHCLKKSLKALLMSQGESKEKLLKLKLDGGLIFLLFFTRDQNFFELVLNHCLIYLDMHCSCFLLVDVICYEHLYRFFSNECYLCGLLS